MLSTVSDIPQVVREDSQPVRTVGVALDAALDAYRSGTLEALLHQYPGATSWLEHRYLDTIFGVAGDMLTADSRNLRALGWLLEWVITQLRPDHALSFDIPEAQDWLDRTSWRPAIAVMCHYRFTQVPDFRDRYYHHPDESPADHLCGLWNVGQSTFYRYLEKGKRMMSRCLHEQRLDGRHTASLREYVLQVVHRRLNFVAGSNEAKTWHARQAVRILDEGDFAACLWHHNKAGNINSALTLLQQHAFRFARYSDTDDVISSLRMQSTTTREQVRLLLAEADLYRIRNQWDRELEAYEHSLHLAMKSNDALFAGVIYARLGKYYEERDTDQSFACYQDSIVCLMPLYESGEHPDSDMVREEFATTLAKLAWLYALRNDPRAQVLLKKTGKIQESGLLSDNALAVIEQVSGEYQRRAGNLQQAIDHKLRALHAYERLRDTDGVIKTWINLGLIYSEAKNFDRAMSYYAKVLQLTDTASVPPEYLVSTYSSMGMCEFWQGNYAKAIEHYSVAVQKSTESGFILKAARDHYNLAEAHYSRFRETKNHFDLDNGDYQINQAILIWQKENLPAFVETGHQLKDLILVNSGQATLADRLLPQELAANYEELSEVDEHRATLAAPGKPEDYVRAHIAIAKAYLALSAKEREAALAIIETHKLRDQFADEFNALRTTYERELTREQLLAARWKRDAGELLSDDKRALVIAHVLDKGSINKSSYAELCSVGLATASKHLGQLAELGLLVQTGKGPSTRYVLPGKE